MRQREFENDNQVLAILPGNFNSKGFFYNKIN